MHNFVFEYKIFMSNLTHLAMQDQNDIAFIARVPPLSLKSTFTQNTHSVKLNKPTEWCFLNNNPFINI